MRIQPGPFILPGRRALAGLAVVLLPVLAHAPTARAADWTKRWSVGFRLGDFIPADEQKGGFRNFSRNGVSLEEVPLGTLSVTRGIKKWERAQLNLEFQVSRFSTSVGRETIYLDPDGSTRVDDPFGGGTFESGDERFEVRTLGDLTLTPVFVNGLFHWSGKANPERADFYVGGGLGVVMAEISASEEYKVFANDYDGHPDVEAENAFGVLIKTGANLRVAKNREWFLYFEAEFMSTGFLTSQSQVSWSGVDYLAGTRSVDTDNNGTPDRTIPADLRLMDSGHVRMDGAVAGIGIRYRFGGKAQAAPVAPEPAATAEPSESPSGSTP